MMFSCIKTGVRESLAYPGFWFSQAGERSRGLWVFAKQGKAGCERQWER